MKWGVRRYQNYDGTLTEAGKKHTYSGRQFRNIAETYNDKQNISGMTSRNDLVKQYKYWEEAYYDYADRNDSSEKAREAFVKKYCKDTGTSIDKINKVKYSDMEDYIRNDISKDSNIQSERAKLKEAWNTAKSDYEKATDKMVKEFANVSVKVNSGTIKASDFIENKIDYYYIMNLETREDFDYMYDAPGGCSEVADIPKKMATNIAIQYGLSDVPDRSKDVMEHLSNSKDKYGKYYR